MKPIRTLCGSDQLCPFRNLAVAAVSQSQDALLGDYRAQLYLFRSNEPAPVPVGRTGSGPGEYHAVIAAGFDEAGVLLFDAEERRVVRFDSASRPSLTASIDLPPPAIFGIRVAGGRSFALSIPPGANGKVKAGLYTIAPDSKPTAVGFFDITPLTSSSGDLLPIRPFFEPKPAWAVTGSQYGFSDGNRFDITLVHGPGRTTRIVADVPPVPISDSDIKARRDEALGPGLSPMMRGQLERQLREAVKRTGKVFPEVTDLVFLGESHIAVRGAAPPTSREVRWDLLTVDGQLVGYVILASGLRIVGGSLQSVLIVGEGADDEPTARWYALAT
jgi:hypothetical protein